MPHRFCPLVRHNAGYLSSSARLVHSTLAGELASDLFPAGDSRQDGTVDFGFDPSPRPKHSRVVVTGLGFVTPFGIGTAPTWNNLLLGNSSISALERHHLPHVRQ